MYPWWPLKCPEGPGMYDMYNGLTDAKPSSSHTKYPRCACPNKERV